jgi:hypothetical protein
MKVNQKCQVAEIIWFSYCLIDKLTRFDNMARTDWDMGNEFAEISMVPAVR